MKFDFFEKENAETVIYLVGNDMMVSCEASLTRIEVDEWMNDLSLWPSKGFAGNANGTLEKIRKLIAKEKKHYAKRYIGGYSLAGLFALYCFVECDLFDGSFCVSGSLWYPGFMEYISDKNIRNGKVYLSLGDKEERTKNKAMQQVGENTRQVYTLLRERDINCVYEINKGGHFANIDQRVQRGIDWILEG